VNLVAVLFFLGILASLALALAALFRRGDRSKQLLNALTLRVSLSVLFFLLLLLAWYTGLVQPHRLGG
jgi:formate-dependent nitrite reductase membrane component NrfD